MPKFTIEQPHALPTADVRKRLDTMNEKLSTKYGIEAKWTSDSKATFSRTGATGTLHIEPAKVSVSIDLAFMLSPMKSQIEGKIRDELVKALA